MFSARRLFREILDDDAAYRLFCSIAAGGEARGGWENGRIAALLPAALSDLAPKVARHGADEDKHGRIFRALLRRRGLTPTAVPAASGWPAGGGWSACGCPSGATRWADRPPPHRSSPERAGRRRPPGRRAHSQPRRLNSRYSDTSMTAITSRIAGYPSDQFSSGMSRKFMP